MENIIVTKILVTAYVLIMTVIGTYFGLCCLKLRKRNKQFQKRNKELQEDLFRTIEQMNDLKNACLELSDTEKKLIYIALTLPALKKEITAQGLNDVCEHIKKKVKDSIED